MVMDLKTTAMAFTGAEYPLPSSTAVSRVMRSDRTTDTGLELWFGCALNRSGLWFRKQNLIDTNGVRVRDDVVFPKRRIAIFSDGCLYHRYSDNESSPRSNTDAWSKKLERNVNQDLAVNAGLREWLVLKIWEYVPVEKTVEIVRAAFLETSPARAC